MTEEDRKWLKTKAIREIIPTNHVKNVLTELEHLNRELETKNLVIKECADTYIELSDIIAENEDEISSLREENEKLKESCEKKHLEIIRLNRALVNSRMATLIREFDRLTEYVEDLEKSLDHSTRCNQEHLMTIDYLNNRIGGLKSILEKLERDYPNDIKKAFFDGCCMGSISAKSFSLEDIWNKCGTRIDLDSWLLSRAKSSEENPAGDAKQSVSHTNEITKQKNSTKGLEEKITSEIVRLSTLRD